MGRGDRHAATPFAGRDAEVSGEGVVKSRRSQPDREGDLGDGLGTLEQLLGTRQTRTIDDLENRAAMRVAHPPLQRPAGQADRIGDINDTDRLANVLADPIAGLADKRI